MAGGARQAMTDISVDLLWIRHGETEFNAQRRLQGHFDVPLTEKGRAQAQKIAAKVVPGLEPPKNVVSSDLSRAWETAELLTQALHVKPRPLTWLREWDVGDWQGMVTSEIEASDPWRFKEVFSCDAFCQIPGGESFAQLYQRVQKGLESLLAQRLEGPIWLVTHGGVLNCAMRLALGLPLSDPTRYKVPNLGRVFMTAFQADTGSWTYQLVESSFRPGPLFYRQAAP
jgi:probable phosphoglycerate mutase